MSPQIQINQQVMQENNNNRLNELKSIRQAREHSVQYLKELESTIKLLKSSNKRSRQHRNADV